MQPFKPEPQRLYRQIAERLRSAILAGDYRPGTACQPSVIWRTSWV